MMSLDLTPDVQVSELHRKDMGSRYVECFYDEED